MIDKLPKLTLFIRQILFVSLCSKNKTCKDNKKHKYKTSFHQKNISFEQFSIKYATNIENSRNFVF